MKSFLNLVFWSLFLSGIYVFWLQPKISAHFIEWPEHEQAASYCIEMQEDFSFPGRKRLSYIIISDAKGFKTMAQTAIKATKDFSEDNANAYVVSVCLMNAPDDIDCGAKAEYATDGGGYSGDQDWTWQVWAMQNNGQPTSYYYQ